MNGRYNFPKLERVQLSNFSLYRRRGKTYKVDERIDNGVFCLAGANGLGKSTMLNAVNYGLTGIVLESNKAVYSPSEIVKINGLHTSRYFKGRIKQEDEKGSEITLTFRVGEQRFKLTRGFFERDQLRELEITDLNGKTMFSSQGSSRKDLDLKYQQLLPEAVGFINFDYFVFYQLYVLTFDENRRMLFWEERASSNALAVAFNSDPRDAEKLSDLSRRMEKHESNGRNARWQATQISNKLKELTAKFKGKRPKDFLKLEAEFDSLFEEVEKREKGVANMSIEFDTLVRNQSQLNFELMQLKLEQAKLFGRYSKPRSKLVESTSIQLSLKRQECCICGSQGSHINDRIERNILNDTCPLCNTPVVDSKNKEQEQLLKLIKANDKSIISKSKEMNALVLEVEAKQKEIDLAEVELGKAKSRLKEFAEDFPDLSFKSGNKELDSVIKQYQDQFSHADDEAKAEYGKRDALRPDYDRLLKRVEGSYKEAQTIFVPIFKKLARSFIGLELSIQLKRGSKGLKLALDVQNTIRTESHQLSESQRFFLDIALRMSLAIFLSKKGNGATMLVDTPEGSLDIAYEGRVGNMFAQFVKEYEQNLFMTANINASQLLVNLAKNCGRKNMKFRRMLDWTDPTEIQKEGEKLFQVVYKNIDKALGK